MGVPGTITLGPDDNLQRKRIGQHMRESGRIHAIRLGLILLGSVCSGCVHSEPQAEPTTAPTVAAILPEMIKIEGGEFWMGSAADDAFNLGIQGPQQLLRVDSFEIARHEVTLAEFAAFVADTGYVTDAEHNRAVPGFGGAKGCLVLSGQAGEFGWDPNTNWRNPGYLQSDRHPVSCVSWNDAQAYVQWLSQRTGARFRLPNEIEFEFVQRAGSASGWAWGDEASGGCAVANGADQSLREAVQGWWLPKLPCADGHAFPAPVGSFSANAFGVHDAVGNVWEWVDDCWNARFAETDEGASRAEDCSRKNHRGGAWSSAPMDLRSGYRTASAASLRSSTGGFRLAR